jgi:tRNA-2-methylthio-N6-dimethylallyladenosine synthase
VRALAQAGVKEVTLLGQTVNSYAHEEARFSDLLRAVARVDGIERVRFTSPYPVDFSDDVIDALASEPKVAKHVHLPLQSGSDDVLARMKRGYAYADFVAILAKLRARVDGIAVSTDLLVGFSGETADDHARTLAAMDELRFDAAFMFAYSEREGTLAARRLADDVPDDVKKTRLAEVISKQERHSAESNARYVGRTERVLVHGASKRGDMLGRTSSFKAVVLRSGTPGQLVDASIVRANSATLFAK